MQITINITAEDLTDVLVGPLVDGVRALIPEIVSAVAEPVIAATAAEGEIIMSQTTEALNDVVVQLDALDSNLARELADFADAVGGKLTAEEQAQLATITTKLANMNSEIEVVDPSAPPAQPSAAATVPAAGEMPAGTETEPGVISGDVAPATDEQSSNPNA